MNNTSEFSSKRLEINCEAQIQNITETLQHLLSKKFRKRGLVVALSGGIDSSVVGALCVRAVGKERVLGLLMPEKDSSPETLSLSRMIAEHLGIKAIHQDITERGGLNYGGRYHPEDQYPDESMDFEDEELFETSRHFSGEESTTSREEVDELDDSNYDLENE